MWRPGGASGSGNKKETTTESEDLMASDTVPAAVPGPDDAASTPVPTNPGDDSKGLLGSLLTPVSAARPATFNIEPLVNELNQEINADTAVDGASSTSYHADENTPKDNRDGKGNAGSSQQTGVIRAWLLAGAERWKKGGDARLKALDIKKARAQALQVKESRTVNRSEKILGGNTNNGTSSLNNTGKSLDNKTNNRTGKRGTPSGSKHLSNTSAKNAPGNNKRADGEGSASRNRESAPEKPAHRAGPGVRAAARDRAADRIRNGPNNKTSAGAKGGKGDGSGKTGSQGPAGKPGQDASGTTSTADSKGSSKKDPASKKGHGHAKDDTAGTGRVKLGPAVAAGARDRLDAAASKVEDRLNARRADPDRPVVSLKKKDDKGAATAETKGKQEGKAPDPKGSEKDAAPANKKPEPDKVTKGPETAKAKDAGGKPWTTQPAREAGYRDGARAGRVAAQARAYKDGARDGWTDATEAAGRDKARLDKAHADRKQDREKPKDQPVPGQPSSADYHQPQQPTPISVTGADATGIRLDGATRPSMSRGEVRTLVDFQRHLAGRTAVMVRVAERSKAYEAHAANQTKKISSLLEQAKSVKGGEQLVEKLTRLEEASKLQEAAAREVHRRAVRGAEGCKALSANADTRYGDIVRAAADSADGPAELTYYQDRGLANV